MCRFCDYPKDKVKYDTGKYAVKEVDVDFGVLGNANYGLSFRYNLETDEFIASVDGMLTDGGEALCHMEAPINYCPVCGREICTQETQRRYRRQGKP